MTGAGRPAPGVGRRRATPGAAAGRPGAGAAGGAVGRGSALQADLAGAGSETRCVMSCAGAGGPGSAAQLGSPVVRGPAWSQRTAGASRSASTRPEGGTGRPVAA